MIQLFMEHPVPQNITSFEFRLIGDMTLKQFGFLATGCTIAYIIFAAFFTVNPYLSLPAAAFFALIGAALAFLPIADRPLDHWIRAFFQSIYSPTQGSWSISQTPTSPNDPLFKNRLQLYLANISPQPLPLSTGNWKETAVVQKPSPVPTPSIPSSDELNKLVAMATDIQGLKNKISETEEQINQLESTTDPTSLPQQQYQQIVGNLQNLLKQTEEIYQKTNKNTEVSLSSTPTHPVVIAPTVGPVEKLPILTSTPNVINGIITDNGGNFLEGIIVIVHNRDGIPVRALKTNKLGQFTAATPLPDGTYNITFEKENLTFDTIQITLAGEVLPAVKINPKVVAHG